MTQLDQLHKEVQELKAQNAEILGLLREMVTPATMLSAREKADVIRAAVATGDRKKLRNAVRKINGG